MIEECFNRSQGPLGTLLIFSYDFPPSNGGIARLCLEVASGMSSHFNEVVVLTRKKRGVSNPYNFHNVKIISLPMTRVICEIMAIKFLATFKRKKHVTILCGIWHPEALLALISGYKNVFVLGHGTEFLSGVSKFRKLVWIPLYAKAVLKKCSLVINNSNYTNSLVKNISDKIQSTSIPLAVNHVFFHPENNIEDHYFKICTVSRIEKFKGHDTIAKSIANLPKDLQEKVIWNIAGTGPDIQYVKDLVISLKIDHIVKFCGFIPDIDLPKFYNSNDLFILCSRADPNEITVEGFGLVFLEAQSCGIPVIGTNSGGIPDAITNGEGGWLIEQDDTDSLEQLLIYLYNNKSILKEMGKRGRERVEKDATWEIYCKRLLTNIKRKLA